MYKVKLKDKIQRLERALKVLTGFTPHERRKHFDMGTWGEKTDCGTVACLAGHCGLNPWFNKRGFRMDFKTDPYNEGELEAVFPEAKPEEFFGEDVNDGIFCDSGATYGETKKKLVKAIKNLKDYGEIDPDGDL